MTGLVQQTAYTGNIQRLPVFLFEFVIARLRPHFGQMAGHTAHIGVDGHAVVVKNDDQRLAGGAGIVETLEAESAAQRTVTDKRQHIVVSALQSAGAGHAQRCGHGVGGVACHKGIVDALIRLGKAGQAAELPQRGKQLPPPCQSLMNVALVAYIEHQPVRGRVEHTVNGHGQLHRSQIGRQMPAGTGYLLNEELPQLDAQQLRLLLGQALHVRRRMDIFKNQSASAPLCQR